MKYDIHLIIKDLCDITVGEVNIPKSELQNLEDAFQCDTVYEIFDMFEGVSI